MNRASTTKSISRSSSNFSAFTSACARSSHGTQTNGRRNFFASGSRSRRLPMTTAGSATIDFLATASRERFKTLRLPSSQKSRSAGGGRGSMTRSLISMPSARARRSSPARTAAIVKSSLAHDACNVMLNWPRVTCSSSASMLACCSNRKSGDAGDDAGSVAADDGDGGVLFHKIFRPPLQVPGGQPRRLRAANRRVPRRRSSGDARNRRPAKSIPAFAPRRQCGWQFFRQADFHLVEIVPRLHLGRNVLPVKNLKF